MWLRFDTAGTFTRDLARGGQEGVFGVDPGLRVIVVYEQGVAKSSPRKGSNSKPKAKMRRSSFRAIRRMATRSKSATWTLEGVRR
jgi:hypothetical protein